MRASSSQLGPLSRQNGIFFVLAAAMLWGTTGTAQAFAPLGYDPKVIGAMRLFVGGAALFAWSAWQQEFGRWRDWNWLVLGFAAFFTGFFGGALAAVFFGWLCGFCFADLASFF